jgi:hypothetical protein
LSGRPLDDELNPVFVAERQNAVDLFVQQRGNAKLCVHNGVRRKAVTFLRAVEMVAAHLAV